MKAIIVGTGTIGTAVKNLLQQQGHEVVTVGRTTGDYHADFTDMASLTELFRKVGHFDAVASAAGEVAWGSSIAQMTDAQWEASFASKGMGQINLVRAALPYIADNGSFTLVSGILADEYVPGCLAAATVNHLVQGFVKAAAVELPRGLRINCISPTVLLEASDLHQYFPGFPPVPGQEVAMAYLRAMMNPVTGRIIRLHEIDSYPH